MISIFRLISFYGGLFFGTIYYCSLGLVQLLYQPHDEVIHRISKTWGFFILKCAHINLDIHGKMPTHNLPAIFITNHQSMLDLFISCVVSPIKTTAIAKKSFKYYPVLGWFMKAAHVIFIDRHHHQRAVESMKVAKAIVESGYSIMIAPEGTRTRTGELQPLKKGAFYLALQTGLPIIPITIVNAYQLFPRHAWMPKPGTIQVYIDEPIFTKTWTETSLPEHIENIRHVFLKHLSETSG